MKNRFTHTGFRAPMMFLSFGGWYSTFHSKFRDYWSF